MISTHVERNSQISPSDHEKGHRRSDSKASRSSIINRSTLPTVNFAQCSNDDHRVAEPVGDQHCGISTWRPQCLQRFNSINVFIALMCLACNVQACLTTGYVASQISTLERRFLLKSFHIGVVNSFFEIGYIFAVIIVTYFGPKGRIPVWIASGLVVLALGAFLFALPQFVGAGPKLSTAMTTTSSHVSTSSQLTDNMCRVANEGKKFLVERKKLADASCSNEAQGVWFVLFCMIVAQMLLGAGSSPMLTLGPTFVDDHVSRSLAAGKIAFLYAATAMGPVFGFMLGAFMMRLNVNLFTVKAANLKILPSNPLWIGCWWGGFIILGVLSLVIASFMFLFPRHLPTYQSALRPPARLPSPEDVVDTVSSNPKLVSKSSTDLATTSKDVYDALLDPLPNGNSTKIAKIPEPMKVECDVKSTDPIQSSWRAIPAAMANLLTNKVYVICSIGIAFEMFLVNGFAGFMPKYLETEYKLTTMMASLLTGGLVVPAGALGIVTGGYVINRFKLRRSKALIFSLVVNILCSIAMISFFFVGCQNPKIAGLTVDYKGIAKNSVNLSSTCNKDCHCDDADRNELCYKGVNFYSPCHAGCTNITKDKTGIEVYSSCSCLDFLDTPSSSRPRPPLKLSSCTFKCPNTAAFLLLLTLGLYLTGVTQNPLLMIVMRSVQHDERAFALGFQFVILRVIAYVPSPIFYGQIIDLACIHWQKTCVSTGNCIVSDLPKLTSNITLLCTVLKICCILTFIFLYLIIRNEPDPPFATPENSSSSSSTNNDGDEDLQTAFMVEPNPIAPSQQTG